MVLPGIEAMRYEGKLKDSKRLHSIHGKNSEKVSAAKEPFKEHEACDTCNTGMTGQEDDADAGRTDLNGGNAAGAPKSNPRTYPLAPSGPEQQARISALVMDSRE